MKFFFVTLLNFLVSIANIFLAPVNALVSTAFPSLTEHISNFINLVNTYFGSGLSYFFSLLPPNTKTVVLLYITIMTIGFSITLALHVILKVITILRHIKVW